ncbi:MAG: portal protein [Candidatus Omnitrophota bacterium]
MTEKYTDEEKVKHCLKSLSIMQEDRKQVEPMVDEIIKFVHHSRRKINIGEEKGQKTGVDIYDGTALSAANLAADGIHGYLCSQSIHWFDFTLPGKFNFPRTSGMRAWSGRRMDEYPEVKLWLDECEEVQYAAFLRSNFYDFSPNFIREGITIGTSSAVIEEDLSQGRMVFTLPHFRECYIAQNRYGMVDTLYRLYEFTMRQCVQKWGEKFLDMKQDFKQQYEKNPYQKKEILHAIFPRTDYNPLKLDKKNKPIASMWILNESMNQQKDQLIEESGYNELPTVTWRWYTNSDEVYGRSPAWDAYVDIKKANQQGLTNLTAGHKMVNPPIISPSDLKGKIRNAPGGQTFVDGFVTKDRMPLPLLTGIQLPYGIEQQDRTDKAIREYFHVDFFLMLYQAAFEKVELTATQVVGMQGEQAAVLGTRIGRCQTEALNPIMDRVFNIETRAGRMPMPPPILQDMGGKPIEIDYMGPLAQAQKRLFKIQGIRAGIELIGQISTVLPYAVDKIDGDKTVTEALDAVGFPAICQNDDEKVRKIREERQKLEELKQTVELAEQASKATQKLSKPMAEGSPMDLMFNQTAGNA